MNGGDDTDQEVEPYSIASLESHADRFPADTGHPHLAVGLVGKGVVHVVRQLTVNADWLQAVQHSVA